jgi:hypothetical protein
VLVDHAFLAEQLGDIENAAAGRDVDGLFLLVRAGVVLTTGPLA